MTTVAVLGAGAWGTAIACHLAERAASKPDVTLWGRDPAQIELIAARRENARYLPGATLPPSVRVTADLATACRGDVLIAAVPASALTSLVAELAACGARAPLVWLCKGFVAAPALPAGVGLAHRVIAPAWPTPVGIVSGPSFAEEVAKGLPTALAVAATEPAFAAEVGGAHARRHAARL